MAAVVNGHVKQLVPDAHALSFYERHLREVFTLLGVELHSADLLLSLPQRLSTGYRERLAELAIEGLGVHSVLFVRQPLLAAYSSGLETCLVVDCGHSYTGILAVRDFYPLEASERVLPLAGRHVDAALLGLLNRTGQTSLCNRHGDLEFIKRKFCQLSARPVLRPAQQNGEKLKALRLPDGKQVRSHYSKSIA